MTILQDVHRDNAAVLSSHVTPTIKPLNTSGALTSLSPISYFLRQKDDMNEYVSGPSVYRLNPIYRHDAIDYDPQVVYGCG